MTKKTKANLLPQRQKLSARTMQAWLRWERRTESFRTYSCSLLMVLHRSFAFAEFSRARFYSGEPSFEFKRALVWTSPSPRLTSYIASAVQSVLIPQALKANKYTKSRGNYFFILTRIVVNCPWIFRELFVCGSRKKNNLWKSADNSR